MKRPQVPGWRLSRYLVVLASGTATLALALVIGLALAWRYPAGEARTRAEVQQQATDTAERSERLLDSVRYRLTQLALLLESDRGTVGAALAARTLADDDLIDIVALTSATGTVQALGLKARYSGLRDDALGLDLSGLPAWQQLGPDRPLAWQGRHLSLFTGELSVSLSVRLNDGRMLLAEVDLGHLIKSMSGPLAQGIAAHEAGSRVWLVDSVGEVLADTQDNRAAGRFNLRGDPVLAPPGSGDSAEGTRVWQHEGTEHHVGVVRSERLGWYVLVMQPAGLDHPLRMMQLKVAALTLLLTPVFCFMLTPLLAGPTAAALQALVRAASDERQGRPVAQWPQGPIVELNELSGQLGAMAHQIHAQQADLMVLNADLEQRVAERTQDLATANAALRTSMHDLQQTRDDLMRNERLASLGGLVAGVAHELNTPLGNGLLAISTLRDELALFKRSLADGMRKSAFDRLLDSVETASDIAGRNIGRAADLVTSFKQVAVDQTSGQRRVFDLKEVVTELVRSLQPTLARTPFKLHVHIADGLRMDSYPGSLGQIVSNLVNNAVLHGFDGRDQGNITIRARALDAQQILLTVHDDGNGIPASIQGRVFDPFFTSRMGRGGTGLGLNIAHSIATNLLGGSLGFVTDEQAGTSFELRMATHAPRSVKAAEEAPVAEPAQA
jgi:signal transduction histidine kinase